MPWMRVVIIWMSLNMLKIGWKWRVDPMIRISFGKYDPLNKNAKFLPSGEQTQENMIRCNRGRIFYLKNIWNGLPYASLVLFPELKEEHNFCNSENKVCSDESYALTWSLVVYMFPCRMHNATNPMTQCFRIVFQLHFEIEQFYNVAN